MHLFPIPQPYPGVSTLNSPKGTVIANAAIVATGTGGAVTVLAGQLQKIYGVRSPEVQNIVRVE